MIHKELFLYRHQVFNVVKPLAGDGVIGHRNFFARNREQAVSGL